MEDIQPERRLTIRRLLRIQAGVAGALAILVYLHLLRPGWTGSAISPIEYAIVTTWFFFLGYFAGRCFFRRRIALIIGMGCAGRASLEFCRAKVDHPYFFILLGLLFGLSLYVALSWLDRDDTPYFVRLKQRRSTNK